MSSFNGRKFNKAIYQKKNEAKEDKDTDGKTNSYNL